MRFLNKTQLEALFDNAAGEQPDELTLRNIVMAMLAFQSELRPEELARARWRNVHAPARVLLVELSGEDFRPVPLSFRCVAALERLKKERPPANDDEFILEFFKVSHADEIVRTFAIRSTLASWLIRQLFPGLER